MKSVGSQTRENIEDTEYGVFIQDWKRAILLDRTTGTYEVWRKNDDFAGYVVVIDGIGYEYVESLC